MRWTLTEEQTKQYKNIMLKDFQTDFYFKDNKWFVEIKELGILMSDENLNMLFIDLFQEKSARVMLKVLGE